MRKITGAAVEQAEEDVSRRRSEDATQMSDLTGRRVEPWEVAFFNGAAILDAIPVQSRDQGRNSIDTSNFVCYLGCTLEDTFRNNFNTRETVQGDMSQNSRPVYGKPD